MILNITPVPAPRMTQSDKWKKRPCVTRYFAFRDKIQSVNLQLVYPCKITFWMPMPNSWSKRKKQAFNEEPHKQKPDLDNLLKALFDSIYYRKDDSHVWAYTAEKRWAFEGGIEIEEAGR